MIIPKIVALTGFKHIGKDTFGNHLVDTYGYTRIAFADPLREKVGDWICGKMPDDVPGYIRKLVELCYREFCDTTVYIDEYVSAKPYSDSLRRLLQFVGTEYYRANDRAYWLKSMHLDPDLHYVIADRRFENETEFSLMMGAACWRINRESYLSGDLHASELQIPHLYNHAVIENEWGRQDKIPALCKHYLGLTAKFSGVVTVEV